MTSGTYSTTTFCMGAYCENARFPKPSPVCHSPPPPCEDGCTTIYAQIASNPELSLMKTAIDAAGLDKLLSNPDAVVTVFAPINSAFVELLAKLDISIADLLSNRQLLTTVLRNHIVNAQRLSYARLAEELYMDTLAKTSLQTADLGDKVVVQTVGCSCFSTIIKAKSDIVACRVSHHSCMVHGACVGTAFACMLVCMLAQRLCASAPEPAQAARTAVRRVFHADISSMLVVLCTLTSRLMCLCVCVCLCVQSFIHTVDRVILPTC